jgi:hypothetical protein
MPRRLLDAPVNGTIDELGRRSPVVPPSGVGALETVVAEVPVQVSTKSGLAGDQGAREGGSPALLEDGPLDSLHAVRLRANGANEATLGG